MSEIEKHTALMFGYFLGGPSDGWSGLASEKVRCESEHEFRSWLMPAVSYFDDAMREENHPDHFRGQAEDRLGVDKKKSYANADGISVVILSSEDYDDWSVLICAKCVPEKEASPTAALPVSLDDLQVEGSHCDALGRAVEALELTPLQAMPSWHIASWHA